MKRFILKNKLPFAKAGAEIIIGHPLTSIYVKTINGDYYIGKANELQRLISEDWIEEIKPREFTLCFQGKRFCGISENGQELWHNDLNMDNCIAVKVREFLE